MSTKLREVLQALLPADVGCALERAERDPEIRSLCDDLEMAVEALQRWSGMNEQEAVERTEEYRELARCLAAELKAEIRSTARAPRLP